MSAVPGADAVAAAWRAVSPRFAAYALVLPHRPSFVCQPADCRAHCCHAFSVSLGEPEADRMTRATGLPSTSFLELEDGEPIALPLAQPYLLARERGHCRFLGEDLGCTVYSGRPNACRLYPHFVVFIDSATLRVTTPSGSLAREMLAAFLAGEQPALTPLLLGHVECPGFTGPPLNLEEWSALMRSTCALQYEHL